MVHLLWGGAPRLEEAVILKHWVWSDEHAQNVAYQGPAEAGPETNRRRHEADAEELVQAGHAKGGHEDYGTKRTNYHFSTDCPRHVLVHKGHAHKASKLHLTDVLAVEAGIKVESAGNKS